MIPSVLGNIIVLALVGLLVFFAARNIVKDVKSGSCGGNCSACGGSCSCHSAQPSGRPRSSANSGRQGSSQK